MLWVFTAKLLRRRLVWEFGELGLDYTGTQKTVHLFTYQIIRLYTWDIVLL